MITFIINEHFGQARVRGDDFFRSLNSNLDLRTDMRFDFSRFRIEHDPNIPADVSFALKRNENPLSFFQRRNRQALTCERLNHCIERVIKNKAPSDFDSRTRLHHTSRATTKIILNLLSLSNRQTDLFINRRPIENQKRKAMLISQEPISVMLLL